MFFEACREIGRSAETDFVADLRYGVSPLLQEGACLAETYLADKVEG